MTSSLTTCDNPTLLSPLGLAFMGDTVYDLLAREALLLEANRPTQQLHKAAAAVVNAKAQAARAKELLPLFTEEEAAVFRRGKNAKPGHVPQTCSREEYALATGLEALFGWLWLKGNFERARKLFFIKEDSP